MPIAIGVDIGGSHITSAGIDLDTFELVRGSYFTGNVDNKKGREVILKNWALVLNKTIENIEDNSILGIGCAMPGPFEYKTGVAMFHGNDKYESLYKVSVKEMLPKYLKDPTVPLRFLNDASAFGVGASLIGNSKNKHKIIAVTLGTGFGASFIYDCFPLTQGKGIPEEGCLWNKQFLGGMADEYFSTRWFVNRYESFTGKKCEGVKEIFENNDAYTRSIFEEFAENFSQFMLPYIRDFDADLLVIGGNIAKSHCLFLSQVLERWKGQNFEIPVSIINRTDEASIVGSAYLFNKDFWEQIKNTLPAL